MNNYYDNNAKDFFEGTVNVDMTSNYVDFLKQIPKKGHILDAGCGSGRDTFMFKSYGYEVTGFDGSKEMCKLASEYSGQDILFLKFQNVDFEPIFDGIWAASSLLHVPTNELDMVLNKLKNSLKDEGVFYASFKYGDFEGNRNGRYFNDFTEETVSNLFESVGFNIIKIWLTNDVRKDRSDERWVNILVNK